MPVEESQEARDRAAIDAAYDPERRAGPRGPHIERYVARSAETREALDCVLDVPYGAAPRETLDIFPSRRAGSPVLLFIHGGYWRALSSKEFSFVAAGLVPHDLTVAVMSYTLCPEATIAEITRQSRAAVAFLAREAQRFAGDPERIVAAGHSAGGQQVGMLLSHDAKVNAKENTMGENALMWAAAENHPEAVKALLEGGADINAGSTVLSLAPFKWVTSGMVSTTLPRGGLPARSRSAGSSMPCPTALRRR